MLQQDTKQIVLHLSLIAVFALAAMSSSFYYGITSGNDLFQHYQFALTIRDTLASGDIYPSVAGTVNHGFGDVALRFYPPLAYYVLSGFYFVFRDWYLASLTGFFCVFLVGGIGAYFWAREEFSPQQSLLAAAIYTFAPYHLNQIYNNFLLAEFSATAVLPFCFLFLTRVCLKGGARRDCLALAISYALLIMTHLPLTVIGSITLAVYGLSLLKRETFFAALPKLFLAVAGGLALSSFYWSRMISEMAWINHATPRYFSETWDYSSNFLFSPQNIIGFQTDVSNLWLADLMLLAIILISIPSIVFLARRRFAVSKFVMGIGVTFLFAVFMATPLSRFVWDNLAFLQKVQFPWRWMSIVSVFGALFASIGIARASEALKESKNVLLPAGLGAALLIFSFTSAFIVKGAVYNSRAEFDARVALVSDAESFDCWQTIWARKEALSQIEKVSIRDREVNLQTWSATEKIFDIGAGEKDGRADIAAFYYPRWKATINDRSVEISPSESGLISLLVPAEQSRVRLYFQEPFHVRAAFYISGALWIIILIFLFFSLPRTKAANQNHKV